MTDSPCMRQLVLANRSHRRFAQDPVDMATLRDLAELARLTPSAANLQPLAYVLSCDPETNARIFATLGWANYLPHWPGPAEGQRPTAYVVILHDTTRAEKVEWDHGIAAQTIMLGAVEKGLVGCMLASVNREKLAVALGLPETMRIILVLALGKAGEEVILEEDPANVRYWRDEQDVHHVPKRPLADIIQAEYGE